MKRTFAIIVLITACAAAQSSDKEKHPLGQTLAQFMQEEGMVKTPCHKGNVYKGLCDVTFRPKFRDDNELSYMFKDVLPVDKKGTAVDQGGVLSFKQIKIYDTASKPFSTVVESMTAKYGRGPDETSTIPYQNGYGAKYDKGLAIWHLDKETICTVEEGFESGEGYQNRPFITVTVEPIPTKRLPPKVDF